MLHSRYVIIVIIYWSAVVKSEDIVRNEDICGIQNGRRLYLELGEQGVLYAKNVSFIKNAPRLQDSRIYTTNSSHDQCSLELVTCPSCVINLTFKSIGLSQNCGDGSFMLDSSCRCDYVWISEPSYEDVSGTPFCGFYSPISYRSNTRTLSITLLYSQSHNHAFTLEYTSERNRINLKGSDISSEMGKSRNSTIGGILTSPFFPSRYPRDLGMEYVITCPNEAPSCRVRVLFSDFQLAAVSIIEFYDWNGQRLDVSSGVRFRPPVIVSSGPSLLIRFYANGGTGLGYKAFYSFVLGHLYDKSVQPITDCGGYVENLGGAITMMDMVNEGVKIYDCVWLIRPPKTFLHMKTHVYLKIITFDDMAGSTELIIKQGPTSALLPLEILRHPASKLQPRRLKEHIAPISSGFHVSLRGTFGPTSHLAMAYTTFSYTDCFTGSDFLCQNHRCIPSHLNCDGFDHCGDNSDEPSTCVQDWELAPQDRKWHTNKANYYFPKVDHYPDLKTATLVFVASSLGLITLISALIVLLYRMGARARQQRELQSRLQTISELLDGARIEEVTVTDDPPGYESPPGYDEVVKLNLENEHKKRKKKKSNSSFRCTSGNDNEPNGSSNVLADDEASTSDSYHCIPTNECNPESPPPPYITPPGSRMNFALPDSSCTALISSEEQFLETTGANSRSLSVSEATTPELSSTTDAELLGAYLQSNTENQTENSTPQLSSWRGASTSINPEFEPRSGDVEVVRDDSEDRKTKKRSEGDDPERGSAFAPLEFKKTAKPRSKKREKKVVTTDSSEISNSVISLSSVIISSASPGLPAIASSESPEENASNLIVTSSQTFLNPSSQISSQPIQNSLISSIKASLNFPTQASIISSMKTSLNSPNKNFISSIKTSLNALSEVSVIQPTTIKNPAITSSSTNPSKIPLKSRAKSSTFENILSASERASTNTGILARKAKSLPKCSTVIQPSEAVFRPETSSTVVEIPSRKLKCVLTSCANASTALEISRPVKPSPGPSATAAVCSRKSSPIPSSRTSPILLAKASAKLVKSLSNPSVKTSVNSLAKDALASSAKEATAASAKDALSSSAIGVLASSAKGASITPVKGALKTAVKFPSRTSANESSPPTKASNSSVKEASSSLAKSSNLSVKASFNPTAKTSLSPSGKASLNSSGKASLNSSGKASLSPSGKASSSPSGNASSSPSGNASLSPSGIALSSSAKASSSPSANDSTIPPGNTVLSAALKAPSTSAAKISSPSSVKASTSSIDARNVMNHSAQSSATSVIKAPSKLKTSVNEFNRKINELPNEKSSLLTSSTSSKSASSPGCSDPGSSNSSAVSTLETNTKKDIIKLLGNSKLNGNSKTNGNYSTASSSPGSTIGKSFMRNNYSRKFSICSRDSCGTKITALSASSSYEKLYDDFEILSEYSSTFDSNSPNITPFNTPKIQTGRSLALVPPCAKQCAKCDLDEAIKKLDSFIAKREKNINFAKNSSRATTLFGTPSHFSKTVDENYFTIEGKRFWSSADDVAFNASWHND